MLVVDIKIDLVGIDDFIISLRAFSVFGGVKIRIPFVDLRGSLGNLLVGGAGSSVHLDVIPDGLTETGSLRRAHLPPGGIFTVGCRRIERNG